MNYNLTHELPWTKMAKSLIGLKEIKGPRHNKTILRMWDSIRSSWFTDDETPWCAGYVGHVLEEVGIRSTRSARARSYEKHGVRLAKPAYGCIVTFKRNGGGHVGFVVGIDSRGNLMVLGGNQGNMVKISPYAPMGARGSRVTGYRWPNIAPSSFRYNLPLLRGDGKFLSNEA